MPDNWDAYFSNLAPKSVISEPSSNTPSDDWDSHFTALAPKTAPVPPPPKTGLVRGVELAGKVLGQGVTSLVTLPGDLLKTYNGTASIGPPVDFGGLGVHQLGFPTSADTTPITNLLGVTGTPQLTPRTPLERYGYAGVAALPAAALTIASGGAAAPSLAAAVGGSEAAELIHSYFPDSKILPLVAGVGAGLTAQGAASLLAGNSVERVAAGLGSSTSMQQGGAAAQEAARNWKTTVMPAKLTAISAPLDAAIPAATPVSLGNYSSILKAINNRAGDLQASADVLTAGGPRRLAAALKVRDELAQLTGGAPGAPTTWANARSFRSIIGDALSDPMLVKDIGQQNLEKLYAGLSQDLGATAKAQGAAELWKQYNNESTRLYNFAAGPLSKVISSDDPRLETLKPEDVATKLLGAGRRGGTDLEALRNEVPEAVNELAAAHLRGPSPWLKLSPEARAALIPDAGQRTLLSAAIPQQVKGGGTVVNALQSLVGYGAGNIIADAAHGLGIGHGGPLMHAGAETLGALAPLGFHGASAIARNPLLLRYPLTGALGAEIDNDLAPAPQR